MHFRKPELTILILATFLALIISCSDMGSDPPANHPPRITSATSAQAAIDSLFSYTATAIDQDDDDITIEFGNVPSWINVSGQVAAGTPSAQTPDTSFTVVATDGALADTALVAVAVVAQISLVSYSTEIQPIFNANCAGSSCHVGGTSNGLSLSNYTSLMQGGNSGVVVIPGDPDSSIIVRRLEGAIQPQMPFGGAPLPQPQIQLIRDWIAQGAYDN